jgi:putative acetyltransferase
LISIRRYRPEDRAATAGVFFRAVREGTAGRYSEAQRHDWAQSPVPDLTTPDPRAGQLTWVAEEAGRITGFMAMTHEGYLDMAFVLPEVMGKGHAAALYDVLLAHAKEAGISRLTVRASHFSRRFLEKRGWRVDGEEPFISPAGITHEINLMSLDLSGGSA